VTAESPTSNAGRHRQPDAPVTLTISEQRMVRLGRRLGLSEREILADLRPGMAVTATPDAILAAMRALS
jgi:hypothetical protein